jgi:hypothetical protein
MHTRKMVVSVVALCALFVSIWMLPDATASEGAREPARPLAEMALSASQIDWQPAADSERLTLTVAGPDGLWLHREFEAGQSASLSLSEPEGERLPDGSYTWELRVVSPPGKQPQKPLVESGHFFVKDGSFVAARKKAPAAPPRPPLSLLTAESSIDGPLAVIGNACIGTSCTSTSADYSTLKLKAPQPNILFDDDFVEGGSTPHDWALFINPSSAAEFSIADFENGLIPFTIAGGAPNSSLYVSGNGNLGLGTATPAVRLDVKANATGQATERLQNSSATGYSGTEYLDNAGTVGLFFGLDNANNNTRLNSVANKPIVLLTNSSERMRVTSAGDIGIGTNSPAAQLHVRDTASGGKIIAENASSTTTPREMLEIKNNGGAAFILKDTTAAQRWAAIAFGSSFLIDNQAIAGTEYVFSPTGNLTIAGVLTQGSDRDTKRDIVPVQPEEILAKVANLPIATWNRKTDPPSVRHMGPMAQDFAAAFRLGDDDRHIATLDVDGVSLASIQALHRMVTEKEAEIAELRRENADLARRLATLEALVLPSEGREAAAPVTQPTP